MDYLFVLKDKDTMNQGWWLKLSTLEDVGNYFETKFTDMMTQGYHSLMQSKEFGHGVMHANEIATLCGLMSENLGIPATQVSQMISSNLLSAMIDAILQNKVIYVNKKGGWHAAEEEKDLEWVRKKELIFPVFKRNQISIKKFPRGTHFYAYVDGLQLRNGDQIKWDTYDEAREFAQKWIMNAKNEEVREEMDQER